MTDVLRGVDSPAWPQAWAARARKLVIAEQWQKPRQGGCGSDDDSDGGGRIATGHYPSGGIDTLSALREAEAARLLAARARESQCHDFAVRHAGLVAGRKHAVQLRAASASVTHDARSATLRSMLGSSRLLCDDADAYESDGCGQHSSSGVGTHATWTYSSHGSGSKSHASTDRCSCRSCLHRTGVSAATLHGKGGNSGGGRHGSNAGDDSGSSSGEETATYSRAAARAAGDRFLSSMRSSADSPPQPSPRQSAYTPGSSGNLKSGDDASIGAIRDMLGSLERSRKTSSYYHDSSSLSSRAALLTVGSAIGDSYSSSQSSGFSGRAFPAGLGRPGGWGCRDGGADSPAAARARSRALLRTLRPVMAAVRVEAERM
ncbi:hypothetical protein FOA52_010108 [Chlamydomonas sp. UWO 241]|nr:hypothetical protein FOA52_010108 [Chlamydomonas sp. UWO 241]